MITKIQKNNIKKLMKVGVWLGISVSLVACAAQTTSAPAVIECAFPGTQQAAPGWICDEPVPGVDVSTVGSHPKTAAGYQFAKTQAATQARAELARQMQAKVSSLIKNWSETTGVGESETVDTVSSATTKLISSETLIGSRIYKSITAPDGTTFVLIGLDSGASLKVQQEALRNSYQNTQAEWQKLQADKSFDELEEEILKLDK